MRKIRDERLKSIFWTISDINKEAYKDIFLIANQVLSKNLPLEQIKKIIKHQETKVTIKCPVVLVKLLLYYIKSCIWYLSYLLIHLTYRISVSQAVPTKLPEELIIIDTYFLVNEINQGNEKEMFLPGLPEVLDKRNKEFFYLPVYYGSMNPFKLGKAFKNIDKRGIATLSEFQLLTPADLMTLLRFWLVYPIHLLAFIKKHKDNNNETGSIFTELINNLDKVVMQEYCRFLLGEKIANLPVKKIRCLGWYENQVLSKFLYKGLRKGNKEVSIIGAQLMVWPEEMIHFFPDDNEYQFDLMPDKILVNGPHYLPDESNYNYVVGPSLRYSHLFNRSEQSRHKKYIIVLLPYFDNEIKIILEFINKLAPSILAEVKIKFHPSTSQEKYQKIYPANIQLAKGDLINLLDTAKMVIGSSTGSVLEAICLGIPGIVIKGHEEINYNYIPSLGRQEIWDFASTQMELEELIQKFSNRDCKTNEELKSLALKIKHIVFCEPTEERIIEAFEL